MDDMKRRRVLMCLAVVMLVFSCSKNNPASPIHESTQSEARQPAEQVPASPPKGISSDTDIPDLKGKDFPAVVGFLTAKGFNSVDLADVSSDDTPLLVTGASSQDINLDDDVEPESLIKIILEGQLDLGGSTTVNVLAWLDHSNNGLKPAGIRVFNAGSCIVEGHVKVANVHIRSKSYFDTVIQYTDAPNCHGDYSQTVGTTVVALMDGKIVDLLNFSDYSESSRIGDNISDTQVVVEISDSFPIVAVWKELETETILYRKVFDSTSRKFVLMSEIAASDNNLGPQTPGRVWGNRCFAHIKVGRYSWALGACNKAIESPEMSNGSFAGATYYNMGLIALQTDDIGNAIRYFRKSLEFRPNNPTVKSALDEIFKNHRNEIPGCGNQQSDTSPNLASHPKVSLFVPSDDESIKKLMDNEGCHYINSKDLETAYIVSDLFGVLTVSLIVADARGNEIIRFDIYDGNPENFEDASVKSDGYKSAECWLNSNGYQKMSGLVNVDSVTSVFTDLTLIVTAADGSEYVAAIPDMDSVIKPEGFKGDWKKCAWWDLGGLWSFGPADLMVGFIFRNDRCQHDEPSAPCYTDISGDNDETDPLDYRYVILQKKPHQGGPAPTQKPTSSDLND